MNHKPIQNEQGKNGGFQKPKGANKPVATKSLTYDVAWTRIPDGNNMILENDKFRISYNPIAGADNFNPAERFAQLMGGMFNGEGEPQEETALYDGDVWRILLGDFRKEYEKAWP